MRSVVTIAAGKKTYWDMAVELARSFELWNKESDITFYIISDLGLTLPYSLRKSHVIGVKAGELGRGFSAKLHLDRYSPSEQCLFIDADCLCVRPIDEIFERFSGRAVSVVGGEILEGEWFGDVQSVCNQVGVKALPKFNGGIYYLEKGPKATAVYDRARGLEKAYDGLGLKRLRDQPNDELLMAIAMAQEGCSAIPDDGSILGDFQACPMIVDLNVLEGRCRLRNPEATEANHAAGYPVRDISPAVVHFLGHHVMRWPYKAEVLKLKLVARFRLFKSLASLIGSAYSVPFRGADWFKNRYRSTYHRHVGVRKIAPSATR